MTDKIEYNNKAQSKRTAALCFKLPDKYDQIVRSLPKRSEFLKHCAALGLILYTKDAGVTGRTIVDMLHDGLVTVADVEMLIKADYLTIEYVAGFVKSGSLEEPIKTHLELVLRELRGATIAPKTQYSLRRTPKQTGNRRRSI